MAKKKVPQTITELDEETIKKRSKTELLFRANETEEWQSVGIFNSATDAITAAGAFRKALDMIEQDHSEMQFTKRKIGGSDNLF